MSDLQDRFVAMEQSANGVLLERGSEIACVLNALVSRSHVFCLATPGTAKTFLANVVVALIEGLGPEDYFAAELGAFSDPAELLGPHDPRALKQGEFRRNTAHRLPRAKLARIGEIWEAPPASLNYLLSILNERTFSNGAGRLDAVPLSTLLCDSNHTPESNPRLQALWDRMTFRLVTRPVQGRGNRKKMLVDAAARIAATGNASTPTVTPVISWGDIERAQDEARQVAIGDDVHEALLELLAKLAESGVVPSERRQVACLAAVQAQAWRARRDVALVSDMSLLSHVLWTRREEAPTVQRHVFGVASPRDAAALAISDAIEAMAPMVQQLVGSPGTGTDRRRKAIDLHRRLSDRAEDLKALDHAARDEGNRLDLYTPISNRILVLARQVLPLI